MSVLGCRWRKRKRGHGMVILREGRRGAGDGRAEGVSRDQIYGRPKIQPHLTAEAGSLVPYYVTDDATSKYLAT